MTKPIIDIIYHRAGGGHEATAHAIKAVIQQQGLPWEVICSDIVNIARQKRNIYFVAGSEEMYQFILRKGLTVLSRVTIPMSKLIVKCYYNRLVSMMEEHWQELKPNLVISVIPFFNRLCPAALEKVNKIAPYVTVVTDYEDLTSNFWFSSLKQKIIAPTDRVYQQALDYGYPPEQVYLLSGMSINPKFYEPLRVSASVGKNQLHLKENIPTGLVFFGGYGSYEMVNIAERLNRCHTPFQMLFICGRNDEVKEKLVTLKTSYPKAVLGFMSEMPFYMSLCDFAIGKAGTCSLTELLQMGLPSIVERNWKTMPQELYNTQWMEERGVGIVLPSFKQIDRVVSDLLYGETLSKYKEAVARIHNRGIFEIPPIIQTLLEPMTHLKEM